jgi:hypothetical protein
MVAPINYALNVASPFEQAVQGLKLGATVSEMEAQRNQAQLKTQQQQAALAEQQRFFGLENPTINDLMRYSAFIPPEQANAMRQQFELMGKERSQASLTRAQQVLSAVDAGNTQVASDLIRQYAETTTNPQERQTYTTALRVLETDPSAAFKIIGGAVAASPGGKELVETLAKASETRRQEALFGPGLREAEAKATSAEEKARQDGVATEFARPLAVASFGSAQSKAIKDASDASFADRLNQANLNERTWNVRNLQSQISDRSSRLGLDAQNIQSQIAERYANISDKLTSIPAGSQKLVNDSAVAASAAKQQAGQLNALATNLEKLGGGYGAVTSAKEFLARSTGQQDYASQLRQEYVRLRNSSAIQSLPPGPATDKDISLALSGFPPENADARYIASFLRGMAKLQDINAGVEGAKVDWLAGNKGVLTRANQDFIAGDYTVKAGETYADFAKRVGEDVSKRYRGRTEELVSQIPGQGAPIPAQPARAAAAADVMSQADAIIRGGQR